jgi:hypothetical protein
MNDDVKIATQPEDEHCEMASEGGESAPTGPDQPWMPDRPHVRSTFSLRVQPDRRGSATPVDSACERRRR